MNEKRSSVRVLRPWLVLSSIVAASVAVAVAAPWIENVRLVPRTVDRGLAATVNDLARGEPGWVAYTVPLVAGDLDPCCHDWRGSRSACRLDDDSFSMSTGEGRSYETGDRELRVLLRVAEGRVQQVRSFGGHCGIDARGATVYALDGVDPAQSVELLDRLVREREAKNLADEALAALSLHGSEAAGRALLRDTAPEAPDWLRAKAAFWLASTRGAESLERLEEMARRDPVEDVREQAVFAISVSNAPGSEALLIDLARRDPRPETRSTALFWLSQEAGERIPDTLREAVEDDPEIEVKERAVFALSQLPAERGVPMLIDLARSPDRHPAVRRAAIFWLGQSGDPRALEFFEEVLK